MDYNNMKAGYQGVKDDMRDMAYKLAGVKQAYKKGGVVSDRDVEKSHEKGVVSDRDMKEMGRDKKVTENSYKIGGTVASKCAGAKKQAYAAGGAAKVRLDVATPDGSPKGLKKGSNKKVN